eukprot:scaffold5330_cov125-Isochrysis_galbana.AAC.12
MQWRGASGRAACTATDASPPSQVHHYRGRRGTIGGAHRVYNNHGLRIPPHCPRRRRRRGGRDADARSGAAI